MERRRSWLPLTGTMPILVILVIVLPSALNLPQTPPQQTLEFAPVPPTDEDPPPPDSGNVSNLGLGTTATTPARSESGDARTSPPPPPPAPPPPPGGDGARPITKRCVGSPPRQTEDPASPPCVGYFDGDNGGSTAPGVTKDEITILVYVAYQPISAAAACSDAGCDVNQYYDLGKPETESNEDGHDERDAYWPHVWRVWQRYFGDRYQTYGRTPHLWVHFGSVDTSAEARVADVAAAAEKVNPFAIVADVDINGEAYAQEWARRGRTVFMAKVSQLEEVGFSEQFFQSHPGQLWDYQPSVEEMADNYGSLLCSQIVGHPVSYSGDGTIGQPRKLGLLVYGHPNYQNRINYANLVEEKLEACGADIVSRQVDTTSGEINPANQENGEAARLVRMSEMRDDGVTTVVNLAGAFWYTSAAGRLVPPWRPEWLVQQDNLLAIKMSEDPSVFVHSRNSTTWPRAASGADRPCEWAYYEVEPTESDWAQAWTICYTYNPGRMLFTAIQVAGPQLTVESLDKGMHAIPAIPSGDVSVPACFYHPGDYTCVKDAQVQYWDPAGTTDRTSEPGCWVSIDNGARYLAGQWPVQDIDVARQPTDTCNVSY